MKIILYLKFVIFSCCLIALQAGAAQISTCTDYPPFTIDQQGKRQWAGTNIESLYKLSAQLNLHLDTSTRATLIRCLTLLKEGKVDIIPGLIFTEERNQDFHMVPYGYKDQLAIFHLTDNDKSFRFNSLSENLLIGKHKAFALPKQLQNSELTSRFIAIRSVDSGLKMVAQQRIDGVIATITTGRRNLAELPDLEPLFSFQTLPVFGDKYLYFAINKNSILASGNYDLKKAISSLAQQPGNDHLNFIFDK